MSYGPSLEGPPVFPLVALRMYGPGYAKFYRGSAGCGAWAAKVVAA